MLSHVLVNSNITLLLLFTVMSWYVLAVKDLTPVLLLAVSARGCEGKGTGHKGESSDD